MALNAKRRLEPSGLNEAKKRRLTTERSHILSDQDVRIISPNINRILPPTRSMGKERIDYLSKTLTMFGFRWFQQLILSHLGKKDVNNLKLTCRSMSLVEMTMNVPVHVKRIWKAHEHLKTTGMENKVDISTVTIAMEIYGSGDLKYYYLPSNIVTTPDGRIRMSSSTKTILDNLVPVEYKHRLFIFWLDKQRGGKSTFRRFSVREYISNITDPKIYSTPIATIGYSSVPLVERDTLLNETHCCLYTPLQAWVCLSQYCMKNSSSLQSQRDWIFVLYGIRYYHGLRAFDTPIDCNPYTGRHDGPLVKRDIPPPGTVRYSVPSRAIDSAAINCDADILLLVGSMFKQLWPLAPSEDCYYRCMTSYAKRILEAINLKLSVNMVLC